MEPGTYVPFYQNGKRDSKRRYIDETTGDLISRRQYDERYGRIAGSTNEREAKKHRDEREAFARKIAESRGDDWAAARMMPEYIELMELLKYNSDQTKWEQLAQGPTHRRHRDVWNRKLRIGTYFEGEMSAEDWHALMSPDSI